MGIIACAYILAIREGVLQQQVHPPKLKIYKNGKSYPAISAFRRGYLEVQRIFIQLIDLILYLKNLFNPLPIKDCMHLHAEKYLQNV